MVEQSPAISVKDILGCIRARLGGAVAVARAAETCAEAGEVEQALPIILDVEQPLYDDHAAQRCEPSPIGLRSLTKAVLEHAE